MIVPGTINPLLLAMFGDPLDELGKINRSLRFRASASANLSWTPATGNSLQWTLSFWVKRGVLGIEQAMLGVYANANNGSLITFTANNTLKYSSTYGGTITGAETTAVYRDPAAHLHVVIAFDASLATETDRLIISINGVRAAVAAVGSGFPTQNQASYIGQSGQVHKIGSYNAGSFFDGHLSHPAFTEDQVHSATAFGSSHPRTGQWRPKSKAAIKAVVDAGGAGSVFLDFSEPTNLTTLCADQSAKGNNWTANNISLTAGSTYDSSSDTPTNNFAMLNPLKKGSTETISDGNMKTNSGASHDAVYLTQSVPLEVKSYFELITGSVSTGSSTAIAAGVSASNRDPSADHGLSAGGWNVYLDSFIRLNNNGSVINAAAGSLPSGTVVQIAIAWPKMWVGVNNIWYDAAGGTTGNPATGANPTFTLSLTDMTPWVESYNNNATINCGQQPWAATCPTGFFGYGTKNLPVQYPVMNGESAFVARTDSGSNIVTTLSAAAPFANWIRIYKRRDSAEGWRWQFSDDAANCLDSSGTAAKAAFPALAGTSYVGYALKIAAANGVASGRIVHVNGVADVVADGLAKSRKLIILRNEGVGSWYVYHPDLTAGKLLYLESSAAETTDATISAVTASGFTVAAALASGTYRWIALAELDGLIKLGKYAGNNSADGPFIAQNHLPALFISKVTSTTPGGNDWYSFDSVQNTGNVITSADLELNLTSGEGVSKPSYAMDFDSNGVKLRSASDGINYTSSYQYAYLSIAAFTCRYANAR